MFEIFACNVDWPANNTLIWQEIGSKWRCILYDLDGCFVMEDFDGFGNATDSVGAFPASNAASTLFFRKLLENENFRKTFCDRYYELKQDELSYPRMHGYLEEYANLVSGEIPSQVERFGFPNSYGKWQSDIDFVDKILLNSNQKMEQAMFNYFDIDEYEFVCFPNPFENELHLAFEYKPVDANEIEIYDLMGQKVFSQKIADTNGINVTITPDLTSGVYILKIGRATRLVIRK